MLAFHSPIAHSCPWRTALLLALLAALAVPQASAKWYFSVKNYLQPNTNVRVFLGYETLTEGPKEFLASINFRPEGQARIFLHRELKLESEGSDTFFVDLQLPPGRYTVDADVEEEGLGIYESMQREEPFQVRPPSRVRVSDIFLVEKDQLPRVFNRPLLQPTVSYDQAALAYGMQIQAPSYEVMSIRAVLYEEVSKERESGPTAYTSLRQASRVLNLTSSGPTVYRDSLDIEDLPGGEYMIQILVYQGDEFELDQKIWFTKGRDIEQRIFGDLDNSIRMMRYLIAADQLEGLLQTEDSVVKEVEFLKIWEKLYGQEAEAEMEAYFTNVYQVADRYAEGETPGWLTDRGRIFIQYGRPKVQEVQIRDNRYERWLYPRWSLSFLFEPRNQGYYLVE